MRLTLLLVALISALGLNLVHHGSASAQIPSDEDIARKHELTLDQIRKLKGYRGLTPQMLDGLPTARLKKMIWRLSLKAPTNPLAAARFIEQIRTGGPNITPPPRAMGEALSRASAMRARFASPATRPASAQILRQSATSPEMIAVAGLPVFDGLSAASSADADRRGLQTLDFEPLLPSSSVRLRPAGDLTPRNWKWLGPANIGGRTRAILVHPTQPSIMWAAGTSGGVWKSLDAGATWGPLQDFMANLNVTSLILDPRDPNTLFAGTGEGFVGAIGYRGMGIFRSRDAGATWVQLPATDIPDFQFVTRLAMTSDGHALLVSARSGLYRSINFREADPTTVAFTNEVGAQGQGNVEGFAQVICSPRDPQRCLAGAFLSRVAVSRDGGVNWDWATGLPTMTVAGRVEVAFAAANPAIVYAGVDINGGEVWRSDDGGLSFSLRSTGTAYFRHVGSSSGQGDYDNAVWAGDPRRPDLVVVGGIDLHRSTDGGRTLERISDWRYAPRSAHADHHAIVSHPGYDGDTNRIVYFGNDGGVYRTNDVVEVTTERGWTALNNNYSVTQFYGIAGNPTSGRLVGGTQDNGMLSYDPPAPGVPAAQAFRTMAGGDGAFAAADPEDSNILYGSYIFLTISRSTNGGRSAVDIYEGIGDAGDETRAMFIAPFILDPHDRHRMLAGGSSLWRSDNVTANRPTWRAIKPPLAANPFITAIEARRSTAEGRGSDLVWIGYENGELFRSTNAGLQQPVWENLRAGSSSLPRRRITRVRAYREAQTSLLAEGRGTLFVTYGGYFNNNIWRSTDDGRSWVNIHSDLPNVAIEDVAAHPRNANWLYAATEIGVFGSADGGATWAPTNAGPANVSVTELMWMGERLVAATYGRGIFWIDLSGPVAVSSTPAPAPAAATPTTPTPAAAASAPPHAVSAPPPPTPSTPTPTEILRSD